MYTVKIVIEDEHGFGMQQTKQEFEALSDARALLDALTEIILEDN